MAENNQTKRAVVLSGGGANGAYEAGVLKALFSGQSPATDKKPFEADTFTGTSVGSFNAGVLVSRTARGESCAEAASELEQAWIHRLAEDPKGGNNGAFRIRADFLDYINPKYFLNDPTRPFREMAEDSLFFTKETAKRSMQFFSSKESVAQRSIQFFDLASALSTAPLHRLVTDMIDVSNVMSARAKNLFVVATNWDQGRPVVFKNKEVAEREKSANYDVKRMTDGISHKAILASTAIPGIFPPVKISCDGAGSSYFVDGGVLMNTPLRPAIRAGAEEIHIVYFDPKLEKLPTNYLPNTLDTTNRFLFIAVSNTVNKDINEVGKVNRQVSVAQKIEPIIDQLKTEHEEQLKNKNDEVARAVERAEKFSDGLADRNLVTVHKHYPTKSLGGVLGLLNFKRSRMLELVELGYHDALNHDCKKNGCVIPS